MSPTDTGAAVSPVVGSVTVAGPFGGVTGVPAVLRWYIGKP